MTIDSYLIRCIDDEISVYENNKGKLEILKKKGEEAQHFNPDIFWEWFRMKIEYRDESLSFVVLTDNDSFTLDHTIKIAEKNSFFTSNNLIKMIEEQSHGLNIILFPNIDSLEAMSNKSVKKEIIKKEIIKKEPFSPNHKNIASYFRNKTESYKNE